VVVAAHAAAAHLSVAIDWDPAARAFHLRNDALSYILRVHRNGALGGVYFGAPLAPDRARDHLLRREFAGFENRLGDPVALEFPTSGTGDYRIPAIEVEHADGSTVIDLVYARHRIGDGKPPIPGLPSTYVDDAGEAETLEVDLRDDLSGLEVTVFYTVFRDVPAVARRARLRNSGGSPIRVTTAMSASLDIRDAGWNFVQLSGVWGRERHVVRRRLVPGRHAISSSRGSSSHHHNPFLMLERPTTTEDHGEAIGFSLVYSGNFLAEAEVDAYDTTRIRLGINPEGFAWHLEPGEELATPEAVLAYSSNGVGGVSDVYHALYRERLARGPWRDRPRPIALNSWEGTYFQFDEQKLLAMAGSARDVGVELFVLDDGWFGERDDDTSSLGDWTVNRRKLPSGIGELARGVEALGLRFGLWIEPEMVSPRSRLFSEHPDWALGVPGRHRTENRNQLVLDMSRPEIVDHLFGVFSEILAGGPISYVKWDMNRYITEPFSAALPAERQGEVFHRYMLGVYDLYARLTEAFPDVLFESCAGGGGRFDPGMLAFAPQAWASDDTDAMERLPIQYGTSIVYPLSSISAHVSATPNQQVGRVTSLDTRAAVAFFGVFGYELDPTVMSAEERTAVAAQVEFYKRWRELFQRGRFIRLRSPFEGDGNETAWMVVSRDARQAIVGWYQVLNRPVARMNRLRLRGLDASLDYRVSLWPPRADALEGANAGTRAADELMATGLSLDVHGHEAIVRGDFIARLFILEAE
jgi:alpha-galactosidase